ncbi:glycohydrolase toxin TNT-related protein [Paenibacillus humicus]|uniref:glycohydrolase toxin TNT-related protein n=1 Tax=Paenibacillus humicus TaxID=412861 RepID=UPI000FD6DBD8|nr:glycohydrolase toxin TNT-related protein [Paenibacillus humicus]
MKQILSVVMIIVMLLIPLNESYGASYSNNTQTQSVTNGFQNKTVSQDTYEEFENVTQNTYEEYKTVSQSTYNLFPVFMSGTPSVVSSTYSRASTFAVNAANEPPRDINLIKAIKNLSLKDPQSLYSLTSGSESISTLNGDVQLTETDLTLPGRGGLSFSLTRFYSASSSNAYDKQTEYAPYCECSITLDAYSGIQWSLNKETIINDYREQGYFLWNDSTYNGNNKPGSPSYNDSFTNLTDAMAWMPYLEKNNTNKTVSAGEWVGPDYNGYYYRSAVWSGSNLVFNNGGTLTPFWRTIARNKSYEQQLFPLGSGWSWNIPYIKTIEETNTSYLSMGIQGTYELSGNNIIGYPWRDLTIESNSSVNVNGEWSSKVVKTKDNKFYYFGQDGRLIQISDRYDNTIKFSYTQDPEFGKVLTTITDALDNKISMTYDSWGIFLYQGNNVIRYTKGSKGFNRPMPYLTSHKSAYLTDVSHLVGPDTHYSYDYKNAEVNFALNFPINNPYYLLTTVNHPSGGRTEYRYEPTPVTRIFGMNSRDQAYRVISRQDVSNTGVYNHLDYTYHSDPGVTYDHNIDSFGSTVWNGQSNTVYDYRKVQPNSEKPMYYTNYITTTANDEKITSTFKYDENRRIPTPTETTKTFYKGSQQAPSEKTFVNYDDFGNITTSTDAAGNTMEYKYDENTHLLSYVKQPIDQRQTLNTEILRNNKGTVTEIILKNQDDTVLNNVKYGNIDSHGNPGLFEVKDNDRQTVYYNEYGYNGGFLTKQSVYATNVDKNTEEIVNFAEYNPSTGAMTSFTDGNSNTSRYEYDAIGRITRVVNPDNSYSSIQYNDSLNEATLRDETGVTTHLKWDSIGQKIEEGYDDGYYRVRGKSGYDQLGRLKWTEDGDLKRTNYSYDAWGRNTRIEYPSGGGVAIISYDGINRTKTTTDDSSGVQTRDTYDVLGQLIAKEIDRGNGLERMQSITYDYTGKALTLTDSKAQTTTNSYDAMGRLLNVLQPNGERTQYQYSIAGNLTQIQYPDGNKLTKRYDELGRMINEIDAKNQQKKYYYDKAGNVVGTVDKKGKGFTFVYNNRNFLLIKQAPDSSISYTYDSAGRRESMTDLTGTTNYNYKSTTRELQEVVFPDKRTISYQYNNVGLRSQMKDPFGMYLDYRYDDMHRLRTVESGGYAEATYDYYDNSLLKEIRQINGVKSSFAYRGLDLSTLTQTKADGTTINTFKYTRDLNGNITQRTEKLAGKVEQTSNFDYDALNRISTSSQFNELYVYDARGNRQSLQSDRNVTGMEGASYQYDSWNQLIQVKKDSGAQVNYKYNGDGLMVERSENNKTVRYYYDGDQIIAEGIVTNGSAAPQAQYIRGNGLIARQDPAGGKTYYLQNGRGDIVDLRDNTGNSSLNQYEYDIWGGLISSKETVSNPFQYSGEYWDQSAGLQYLRARWYDPSMGRFISEDTYEGKITDPLSFNLYAYVSNNPLRYTDPTGHKQEVSAGGGAGIDCGCYKRVDEMSPGELAAIMTDPTISEATKNQVSLYILTHQVIGMAVAVESKALQGITKALSGLKGLTTTPKWVDEAGNIKWPGNDGFAGAPSKVTLKSGTMIDRFGYESGSYASPVGTSYAKRALAPGTENKPYHIYEVVKPIETLSGKIAAWFDQPGGGIQYKFNMSIEDLLKGGYIREVKK